ncbi:MAG TPA: hypothetical protein VFX13_07710 [Gaiellales bacterium]|nr:hypothetical protein [Gaiellales bacterium]
MQYVTVHKAYLERVLGSIADGEPIEPMESDTFSAPDLLSIAGACFFAIIRKGQPLGQPDLTPEQQQAERAQHEADLAAAIIFTAQVYDVLSGGEYDVAWEEKMRCRVAAPQATEQFKPIVDPYEGWKTES